MILCLTRQTDALRWEHEKIDFFQRTQRTEWRNVDNMGPRPHYSIFKLWQLHWRFCWTKSNLRLQIGVGELISFDMKLQIQLIQYAQHPLIWEWQIVQGLLERFLQWRSNSKNNFTGNQSLSCILHEVTRNTNACPIFSVSCFMHARLHGTAVRLGYYHRSNYLQAIYSTLISIWGLTIWFFQTALTISISTLRHDCCKG